MTTGQGCTTHGCTARGVAHLSVRRPCGHPVRDHEYVQLQWTCTTHLRERAGGTAPGPSTCPTCQVRAAVTIDPLVHATTAQEFGTALCGLIGHRDQVVVYVGSNRRLTTCPDCLEWLHA